MAVVGSVQIFLDVDTRRMSNFTRAAATVARDSAHMRRSVANTNSAMANAFTRTAAAVSVLHGPLGGVASRISSIGTLARTSSAAMAGLALTAGGAGFAFTKFVQVADRMRLMENQLKTVTGTTADLRDVQQELLDVSQRARAAMGASATIYARTARATEHLGLKQKDLLRITETVQKAFAIGGATTAEAQGAAIQLSQGIASNRFSGDEFRSVAENAPVLLREMGKSIGVNIGKLREMAHAGELTADVVTKAILDASGAIDRDFAKTGATIGQAWTKVRNEVDMYVHDVDRAYGITHTLAGGLLTLADNFDTVGDTALVAAAAVATFMSGRLGAAALGKNADGKAMGIRGVANQIGTHGLFYGVRRQAKADLESARKALKDIEVERSKIARDIADVNTRRDARLVDMGAAHANKLALARNKEIDAHKRVNGLTAERIALTGNLSKAQAAVVQQLKLEQQEALKAVRSHSAQSLDAGRRFRRYGRGDDLLEQDRAQKNLAVAQERYAKSMERLELAKRGAFDDAAIRRYSGEIRKIEGQIKANATAMASARQQFAAADAAYIAAQRQGATYAQVAADERTRALRQVADLENRQYDLNRMYEQAGVRLQAATKQMTLLGAAQMRIAALGRGMWGMLGGGPGVAIMAALGGFLAIQNSIHRSRQRTEEWITELREAGYLVDSIAKGASEIDNAIETKNVSLLRERLREAEAEINKIREGGFWSRLGFGDSQRGIDQVISDVTNEIERLNIVLADQQRIQGTQSASLLARRSDFLRFDEIIRGARESGELTQELNGELQDLANKHNELDPLLVEFRSFVEIVRAGVKQVSDLNKELNDLAAGNPMASAPAWIQDLSWQTDQQRANDKRRQENKPFFDELERAASRSDWEKTVEDRAKKIMEAAEKAGKAISEFEARAAARIEMAADAANKGLRDLIGHYEGTDRGRGYNETLGYGRFTGGDVNLTQMTLREILELQRKMLAHPDNHYNSSAVGRYQIVSKTLKGLIKELGLSLDTQFTPELQDRLADQLIRGRGRSVSGLRNEWEGLRRAPDQQILGAYDNTSLSLPNIDPEVFKRIEGLKDLRLDALAGQMDEFNQKIVQQAQALGVTREEIEQYIRAVTTGDLQNVPAVFHDIALAMDEAANNELMRSLKDLQVERSVMMLSDIDKELVNIARSAGLSAPAIAHLISVLKSGDSSQLPETLKRIREELKKTEQEQQLSDLANGWADAFGDFFRSVLTGAESFEDALANLGRRLAEVALEILVIQPLVEMLKNSFKGLGGGGGGGGFLGALFGMFFHSGGTVGSGGRAGKLPLNAPYVGKAHTGRTIGKKNNHKEVLAALEVGETVLTEQHTQGVVNTMSALSAAAAGSRANDNVMHVAVSVDDDGKLKAYVEKSERRAIGVSATQIAEYDAGQRSGGVARNQRAYSSLKRIK